MQVRERKRHICFMQLVAMYTRPILLDPGHVDQSKFIDWDKLARNQASRMLIAPAPEEHIIERGTQSRMLSPEDFNKVLDVIDSAKSFSQVVKEALADAGPDAVKTYTVARKKDGEIVGVFTKEEDAQALIDKAKAGKKAALILL